jgi:hypothetical protein
MSRAVRKVAPGWVHPKYPADYHLPNRRGRYVPLLQSSFAEAEKEWSEGYALWQQGLVLDWDDDEPKPISAELRGCRFTDYYGERPSPDDFMPAWSPDEASSLMMYEETSEGTPISPAFETPEALARWLADNNASAFADATATYDQWLPICKGGWAPSAVLRGDRLMSGVGAMSE